MGSGSYSVKIHLKMWNNNSFQLLKYAASYGMKWAKKHQQQSSLPGVTGNVKDAEGGEDRCSISGWDASAGTQSLYKPVHLPILALPEIGFI